MQVLKSRCRKAPLAVLCLVLWFGALYPASSEALERVLGGITSERLLMINPEVLGPVEAQTAVRTRARFQTGQFDVDRIRAGETPDLSALVLVWDLSFGGGDALEFGASLSGGYTRSVDGLTERISLERGIAFGRFAAKRDEDGSLIAATFAVGRQLWLPGNLLAELGGQFGWRHGWPLSWDVDVWVAVELPKGEKTILFGGVGAGPWWHPTDWFDLSFEVMGRVANSTEIGDSGQEAVAWDTSAALQAGFSFGERHCISVGVERTLYGASVRETLAAHLVWRFEWETEEGLLRLDNDGSLIPEPEQTESPAPSEDET